MTGKKYEKAFGLDMPFDEALKRFAKTDPHQTDSTEKVKAKERASRRTTDPSSADKEKSRPSLSRE